MVRDKDGEIHRLQSVLREIVSMLETPSVPKATVRDYAKAALHASSRIFEAPPQAGGDDEAEHQ
jgi:hypothetical protein